MLAINKSPLLYFYLQKYTSVVLIQHTFGQFHVCQSSLKSHIDKMGLQLQEYGRRLGFQSYCVLFIGYELLSALLLVVINGQDFGSLKEYSSYLYMAPPWKTIWNSSRGCNLSFGLSISQKIFIEMQTQKDMLAEIYLAIISRVVVQVRYSLVLSCCLNQVMGTWVSSYSSLMQMPRVFHNKQSTLKVKEGMTFVFLFYSIFHK